VPARILVIEDDPASLELLRYMLEKAGHSVAVATDGSSGLAAALANEFDLIFCDIELPELTGYEVAERLCGTPGWKAVPLVAVTAFSMPGDRDTAIAAGFNEYLTKPIAAETFLVDVNRLLKSELRGTNK
jgi:two-component system cell cycle response regulator DivK